MGNILVEMDVATFNLFQSLIQTNLNNYTKNEKDCWIWNGAKTPGGYGAVRIAAHRIFYTIYKGQIPTKLQLDHLCKERMCVNPSHLEAVTQQINILRGNSISARYAQRTHCKMGHPLDGIKMNKGQPSRRCLVCHCERQKAYYHRKYK